MTFKRVFINYNHQGPCHYPFKFACLGGCFRKSRQYKVGSDGCQLFTPFLFIFYRFHGIKIRTPWQICSNLARRYDSHYKNCIRLGPAKSPYFDITFILWYLIKYPDNDIKLIWMNNHKFNQIRYYGAVHHLYCFEWVLLIFLITRFFLTQAAPNYI